MLFIWRSAFEPLCDASRGEASAILLPSNRHLTAAENSKPMVGIGWGDDMPLRFYRRVATGLGWYETRRLPSPIAAPQGPLRLDKLIWLIALMMLVGATLAIFGALLRH